MLDFEFVRGMLDFTSVHWQFWGSTCVCILLMGAQLLHSIIILSLVELTFGILLAVCFHTTSEVSSVLFDLHLNLAGNLVNISLAYRADLLLIVHWQCLDSCCLFVMRL